MGLEVYVKYGQHQSMYKADTDEAQLSLLLPPLPLEAWDTIISKVDTGKEMCPLALVCWDFALLVRRRMCPRVREIGGYAVKLPDNINNKSNMFIGDDGVVRYAFVKKDEEDGPYYIWLVNFYLTEYQIKRLWALPDLMRIVVCNSQYVVFSYEIGYVIIMNMNGSKIGTIGNLDGYRLFMDIDRDRLYIFKIKYFPVLSCNLECYHLTKDTVNIIYNNIIQLPSINNSEVYLRDIIHFNDRTFIMFNNIKNNDHTHIYNYNVEKNSIEYYILPIKFVYGVRQYVDTDGLLIIEQLSNIYIYAKDKLLAKFPVSFSFIEIICSTIGNDRYIHAMGNGRFITYKY